MKMEIIHSPWRYDAPACHVLQSVNLRRFAILRYAAWTAVFSVSQDSPEVVRKSGGVWRRQREPKWRATVDEDEHYVFAVAL